MYKVIGTDRQTYGPVTAAQLRQWLAEGRVDFATLVQAEGAADWKPLSSFPEFGPAPQTGTPPPVSMPPPGQKEATGENMAIAGLVLGALSIVGCCVPVFGVLGVIFSLVALCQERPPGGPPNTSHKNIALGGLILSIIGLAWHVLALGIFGGGALLHHWRRRW